MRREFKINRFVMGDKKLDIKNDKSLLTENEKYRLVKWIGINGGLLGQTLKIGVENNDYGWLLLPGIMTAITTIYPPTISYLTSFVYNNALNGLKVKRNQLKPLFENRF
jgi:uncharacterized membrane protein YkgB